MDIAHQQVVTLYGQQLRLRVCGLCIENDRILMINHLGVVKGGDFWCPPGGGLQFGESVTEGLTREFLEETHTQIEVGEILFVNEFLALPLHAIELFFTVKIIKGEVAKGFDPEMTKQIIDDIRWMTFEEIKALPPENVHRVFSRCTQLNDLLTNKRFIH
jgi:ADP-ribose pyrophosphatase YjhB (NUDIX family)